MLVSAGRTTTPRVRSVCLAGDEVQASFAWHIDDDIAVAPDTERAAGVREKLCAAGRIAQPVVQPALQGEEELVAVRADPPPALAAGPSELDHVVVHRGHDARTPRPVHGSWGSRHLRNGRAAVCSARSSSSTWRRLFYPVMAARAA